MDIFRVQFYDKYDEDDKIIPVLAKNPDAAVKDVLDWAALDPGISIIVYHGVVKSENIVGEYTTVLVRKRDNDDIPSVKLMRDAEFYGLSK